MADISKIILPNDETVYEIKDAKARMVILAYGKSTWADFLAAYQSNTVVYCRASSGSNPASGAQTRMAFMAYINNEANPTEVEFQYYRSVNQHTDSQQGDQVYVYKLNKSTGWSVTVRSTFTKVVAGTGLSSTFTSGNNPVITLNNTVSYESKAEASGGTDESLVTTGEKYIWNHKADTTVASTSANGLMSSTDKTKLDGLVALTATEVQTAVAAGWV